MRTRGTILIVFVLLIVAAFFAWKMFNPGPTAFAQGSTVALCRIITPAAQQAFNLHGRKCRLGWKQNEDYFIPLFAEIKAGGAAASPQQMRATIEALPYEVPKLSAVGVGYFTHDTFAERLDRAIDQSNRVLVEGHAR